MSLMGKSKNGKADRVEDRLRARLADLEGRLEDNQKVQRLEAHIVHLNEKHALELEKVQVNADQKVNNVKTKAGEVVNEAKRRVNAERKRYHQLVEDIQALETQLKSVAAKARGLSEKGLKVTLAPQGASRPAAEDPNAFVGQVTHLLQDMGDRLDRIDAAIGDGALERPTTDLEILEERSQELLTNPELRSKALTVTEKARMFATDPGKSQYYRELIIPYAKAIHQVLEADSKASTVYGAQEALQVLQEAFRDSRTFLLRRSGDLDDHTIEAEVIVERLEESAEDAIGRMGAMLDNARALGPVDFFHNLQQEVTRRVERGEKGSKAAAWILSDVTVTILEDERVRKWLAGQR